MRNYVKNVSLPFLLLLIVTTGTVFAQSPGGKSTNLTLWLKANAGVTGTTSVTQWNDQSGNSQNFTPISGREPSLVNVINFNPAIQFNPSQNDVLQRTGVNLNPRTIYVVYNDTSNANWATPFTTNSNSHGIGHGDNGTPKHIYNNTYTPNDVKNGNVHANGLQVVGLSHNRPSSFEIISNVYVSNLINANTNYYVGADRAITSRTINGNIAEIITYSDANSSADRQKIESYLALKYGITLNATNNDATITEGDYILSDGTTKVWDFTANSTYHNDVSAIGRDDNSALNQKQSRSINSDAIVTIGLGTIAATNAANSNTFTTDKDFIVWGNNNGSTSTQTTERPSGANAANRLGREWKVAENGTVSNLTVAFSGVPANASNIELYVDTDGDGDFSDASIITGGTLSNGSATFSGVNLNNNDVFTLGYSLTNPGGISANLALWLKADKGVTESSGSVSAWSDLSGNNMNGTGMNTPTLQNGATNFNPTVVFDRASSEYIDLPDGFANFTAGISAYFVAKNTSTGNYERYFDFGNGASNNNILFARVATTNNGVFEAYNGGSGDQSRATNFISNNTTRIYAAVMQGGTPGQKSVPSHYRDGLFFANNGDTNIPQNVTRTNNYIARSNWADAYFNGEIAEVILYNDNNSAAHHQRIQSYLGLKYGITLNSTDNDATVTEGDYILSDGTTKVWNFSTNSLHHHDVAGIGRDDGSDLNQKQSKSVNSDAIVTIGLGEIAATNAANSNTFSADKNFLVWGNDNGSVALQTTERPSGANAANRFGREWKVAENGSISNLTIAFSGIPSNATNIELYVDTDGDGDFSDASIITGGTLSNGSAVFSGVNLNNNYVFTLGYSIINTYPGGVSANLNLWLKANDGVVQTGNNITAWNDFSGNALNGTAINTPTLSASANNFNPTVNFTRASSEYIDLPDGFANFTAGISAYVVAKNTSTGSWERYFDIANGQANNNIVFARQGTGNNGAFEGWNGGSGDQSTITGFVTNNVNRIYSVVMQGGTAGQKSTPTTYRDGLSISNSGDTFIPQNITRTSNYIARSNWGADAYFNGEISEVILYNDNNSGAHHQRIQSYLALKYGITLSSTDNDATITEGDYILSDGTTKVWDFTANSTYHNDVAGIGFDETSALHQKQSKSANSDAIVTIGLGSIASSNAANTNTFSTNKDFIVWGNDNGSTSTQTTELPSGANATSRLGREWKVSENGTVNNLTVTFDVSQTNLINIELYVDTDGDGNFANATVITGGSIIDGKATFTGVDLNNNNVFTLGYTVFTGVAGYKGPGGVGHTDGNTQMSLWLDANTITGVSSGSSLTTWNDNSGQSHNATQSTSANRATYNTNQINGYPSVNFDGENDDYTTGYIPVTGAADRTLIAVINNATDSPSRNYRHIIHYGNNASNQAYGLAYKTGAGQTGGGTNIGNHYWANGFSGTVAASTATTLLNIEYGGGVDSLYVNSGYAGRRVVTLNTGNDDNLEIGTRISGGNESMAGQIGEVVVFNAKINQAQRIIVDNYLAAKYGVTLSANDFFNEDDAGNGNFDHDVAGIGQATDGTNHQDAQGTGIIRINTPSGLGNDEYLFWGRNNRNAYTFTTSSVYTERLSSVWRVSKRNDLGTVTLEVDLTGIDLSGKQSCAPLRLVVDNDSNLASPTSTYTLTNITGNIYRATGVTFADNDYFSIEYIDQIVLDGTQAYNGSGASNVPNTSDDCFKLLIKNTADGTPALTENADVREVEVESGGKLVVNTGTRLQVTNAIANSGEIRLLGTSQLIQTHTGPKQVTGTGNLYKDRQGVLTNVYQSGYWTSPVTTNGSTFTIKGVMKDGTTPLSITSPIEEINFTDIHTLDGSHTSNPITISGRWLAKLINATDWTRRISPTTETFNPGEGWNMKSTGNSSGQNYTFVGIPNDGSYTSTINTGTLSLVGNPYPSALNADQFIADNTSAISGTLYFYDAGNDTSHNRGEYTGGYATRVSGVGTPRSGGSKTPGQYIDVGQAFFVTRDAAGSGFITFQNSQRSFQTSPQFFSKSKSSASTSDFPLIRLWFEFGIGNSKTFKRELAITFRGLTNDYEFGFDAEMFDKHPTDIGLKVNNRNTPFVITGIGNFDQQMEIPLLVYVDNTKNVTFKLEELKNLTTKVYIKDAVTQTLYDISSGPKTLNLDAGTYRFRFSMVFVKGSTVLSVDDPKGQDKYGASVYVNPNTHQLLIQKPNELQILESKLYNLLGQELKHWKNIPNAQKISLDLPSNMNTAVYIVRIRTDKGTLSKKIHIK